VFATYIIDVDDEQLGPPSSSSPLWPLYHLLHDRTYREVVLAADYRLLLNGGREKDY
jgi:hypothetical protein